MSVDSSPTFRTDDTMSSICLFIGIPTQEHRTVLGSLTKLIGNLLRLAHQSQKDPPDMEYDTLIQGASAYSSVFGHWVSKNDLASRVDDHSEVIQFFTAPGDFYPTLILILCELAYPALVAANQDAILVLITHAGEAHRVILWRQRSETDITARTISEEIDIEELDKIKVVDDDALQSLRCLLSILVRGESEATLLENESSFLGSVARFEEGSSLYKGLFAGWSLWLQNHGDKGSEIEYNKLRDHSAGNLPTIYIRALLDVACWWLFYGASQTIKDRVNGLWDRGVLEVVIQLLQSELSRIESTYFPSPMADAKKRDFGLESDDPLPNAILWLAFVHDFLAYCHKSLARIQPEESELNLFERADPLSSDAEDVQDARQRPPETNFELKFDEFAKRILPTEGKTFLRTKGVTRRLYWTQRLDLLEKLNDRYFPDQHLLDAWRVFFYLVKQPKIVLETLPASWCDSGYSVKWAEWISGDYHKGPDKWVKLDRILRDASPITRLWLTPFITEATYKCALGRQKSIDYGVVNLRATFQRRYPRLQQGISIIEKITWNAIRAFPMKLDLSLNTKKLTLSSFIASLQKQSGII